MTTNTKEILEKIKKDLIRKFGKDIKDVILFGSQVKGNNTDSSDYDLLVVINRNYDWRYKNKIFDTLFEIEYEHEILIDVHLISVKELNEGLRGAPLFQHAISKGIYA